MPTSSPRSQHVLVLNSGSSSLKFAIIDSNNGHEVTSGLAERLGSEAPSIKYKYNGTKTAINLKANEAHAEAINTLVALIKSHKLDEHLIAVGHRVVHGGEHFIQSILIDEDVILGITQAATLAPLHGHANLLGISSAKESFKGLPQVAVFDTAFHQTMDEVAYLYALPYKLYTEFGVRRYGFHGTSHCYVADQAAQLLNQSLEESNFISAHLGNGCSVCAIKSGKSVDTSMGLTPLAGLIMGMRSGDIDPGLFNFLTTQLNYSAQQIDDLLNQESGLLGISGLSNDCRTIEEASLSGNQRATLAIDMFCYRLAKQIAAYMVPLQRLDAVIFTGGIGENSNLIRKKVISQLAFLNIDCDEEANLKARFGQQGIISIKKTKIKVIVIPTNEEWVIANDAASIVKEL
ncbi:acetate kinase [Pseudoalteromonas sp. FUC4]|uniref:acetate kinase n=1 Tax=Pseudoalteromonas sp. FUC4 TaxID=2511201 RepID=UPI0011F17DB8|nr:acetate kinase [Pseudoalteromonas sp. FUC4]KAA1155479.1 acetate kinase [Pseudoalteromonas sp. FUC4]